MNVMIYVKTKLVDSHVSSFVRLNAMTTQREKHVKVHAIISHFLVLMIIR